MLAIYYRASSVSLKNSAIFLLLSLDQQIILTKCSQSKVKYTGLLLCLCCVINKGIICFKERPSQDGQQQKH